MYMCVCVYIYIYTHICSITFLIQQRSSYIYFKSINNAYTFCAVFLKLRTFREHLLLVSPSWPQVALRAFFEVTIDAVARSWLSAEREVAGALQNWGLGIRIWNLQAKVCIAILYFVHWNQSWVSWVAHHYLKGNSRLLEWIWKTCKRQGSAHFSLMIKSTFYNLKRYISSLCKISFKY